MFAKIFLSGVILGFALVLIVSNYEGYLLRERRGTDVMALRSKLSVIDYWLSMWIVAMMGGTLFCYAWGF